jgi:hypothetical protein
VSTIPTPDEFAQALTEAAWEGARLEREACIEIIEAQIQALSGETAAAARLKVPPELRPLGDAIFQAVQEYNRSLIEVIRARSERSLAIRARGGRGE